MVKKELKVSVLGTSSKYQIVFLGVNKEMFSISCSCKAGIFGKICKHKTALILDDYSNLVEKEQEKEIVTFKSSYEKQFLKIKSLYVEIKEKEKEIKKHQKELKEIKETLEDNIN